MNASIAQLVRRADPDRYLSALFAPEAKRPLLHALYAFNIEIARVAETVREPMMAEIRLEWWRETLEGAREGRPRNHDTARALADLFAAVDLPQDLFLQMIAARSFDSTAAVFGDRPAVEAYSDATSGNVMRLAALVLGHKDDGLARDAGIAYALAGLVRSVAFHRARHKLYLPQSLMRAVDLTPEQVFAGQGSEQAKAVVSQMALWARAHCGAAHRAWLAKDAVAAYLPAALTPLYLRRATKRWVDPLQDSVDIPIHRRQVRLLSAAMRRRL
ncbi:MAG TPA: squalene/phytoene synthase family protein [Rhizomicrobium sp.]|nr:squalene/phytoene synthase family protein [Rhizomicrobium sp.]